MNTWLNRGASGGPGRGLKTVEKLANSQFNKPPHTEIRDTPLRPPAEATDFGRCAWRRNRSDRAAARPLRGAALSHPPRPPQAFRQKSEQEGLNDNNSPGNIPS